MGHDIFENALEIEPRLRMTQVSKIHEANSLTFAFPVQVAIPNDNLHHCGGNLSRKPGKPSRRAATSSSPMYLWIHNCRLQLLQYSVDFSWRCFNHIILLARICLHICLPLLGRGLRTDARNLSCYNDCRRCIDM